LLKLQCHPFSQQPLGLLPDSTLVESQLLPLEDISIHTTALPRTRRNDGVQTASLKLSFQTRVNLAVSSEPGSLLLLYTLALFLFRSFGLLLSPSPKRLTVMGLVPLSERSGVNLNDGRFGEGIGTDEFIVGWMIRDDDHADLTGHSFRCPGKVPRVETESTVFLVSTPRANKVDSLRAYTGVRWLTTLLKSPTCKDSTVRHAILTIRIPIFSIPLLAIEGSLCTGGRAFVTGVA
jgi:hypothetical protein